MPRVKRGVTARARHKKVMKAAKGYYGARSRVYRVAVQAVTKAGQYAYRDRRQKKRQFRQLWIARIFRSYQRCSPSERSVLQPSDQRSEEGFHRDRSQDPVRYRRSRQNGFHRPG